MRFVDLFNYYLAHNFALLVMAVGFLIMFLNPNSRLRWHSRLLIIDTGLLVLLSVFTTIEYCFEALKVTYPILYVAVIFGYSLRPVIIYTVILTFRKPDLKFNLILAIPIFVNLLMVMISPATHWIFYYGENNVFVRVIPWGFLPHVTAGFYLVYLGVLMVRLFHENDKTQAIAAVVILVANTTATCLETFDVAEDILNSTAMASILFYFAFMFTYFKKRDSLTGLQDRHTFYVDFTTHQHHVTALVGFDLNGLKRINDSQGHASGDLALKTVGRIFLAYTSKNLRFYRLGGDEFEAICVDMNEEAIKEKLHDLSEAIKRSGYNCSYGYAMRLPDEPVDDLLRRADEAMYSCKRGYYRAHPRPEER